MSPQDQHPRDSEGPETLASLVRLIADRAADSVGHRAKICFLLGAGADVSSGGLTFVELKRQAVEEYTKRPLFDITLPEQIEARFEDLFVRLQPDERALLVDWIFHRMKPLQPSDAYKLLILLAEAGGIDAVVTTNFDLMLETAQAQMGRDIFQVFAPGVARPYLLSQPRFELAKKPYLKLHGDIASRSVTLLTSADLESAKYDLSMLELLRSILSTHDLVLIGYSGFDGALAPIIADAVMATNNRIFWCNPRASSSESPLYSRVAGRVRIVRLGFDNLMMEVARPVLERPSLATTEPTYLRCLFDWRVDYCNKEYVQAYGERAGISLVDVFARRRLLEKRLQSFLLPNRPLAIVTGASGFGKTTLGIRLYKTWGSSATTKLMLIRSRSLRDNGDIEQHIVEQLGGLGSKSPFSLFQLERWIRDNGLRLVLYIDGINEFSSELARCIQFLRNIVRLCYFLPEIDSALRVIVTIRQETWSAMLPHIDSAQLQKTVWSEGDPQASFSTIACTELTDDELQDAITRFHDHGYASIKPDELSPSVMDQLRDPYLLGAVAEAAQAGLPPMPSASVYGNALEAKLQRRDSLIDKGTLKEILSSLALKCLTSQQDRFREIEILPIGLRGEIIRTMKDLNVFVDAGQGFLQFDHDRTLEYFLALAFASGAEPSLETMDDLLRFLQSFKTQSKPIAAARLYFQLNPREFSLISTSLRLLDSPDNRYQPSDRETLFGFARDVLVQMTEQREPRVQDYLNDVIDAARAGGVGSVQLRTVVQSAASLPVESAVPLLTKVGHPSFSQAQTEANIFATDKLVKQYLVSRCPAISLLHDKPYAVFFGDSSIAPWQRLGRLLRFSSQLGPDNTHPNEYNSVLQILDKALTEILSERPWSELEIKNFAEYFIANSDRLLFNATTDGISEFFSNPRRPELEAMLDNIQEGGLLTENDLDEIQPYTTSLSFDVEYHLSHALGILSSFNDLEHMLRLMEARFQTFSNDTSPNEIDFFYSLLVYLHVLHNLPYDEARFKWWEESVLRDWPGILQYRPGLERGERRGFHDAFDRVFEDGFSVVFPYGVLLPSLRRRRSVFADYRRELASESSSQLPMYTRYLEEFLHDERIEEALQILQALAGVIVAWPVEGLLSLRGVVGHSDPRIRRATVRILAEAFNRHPEETMQFLKTSGAAVSEEELIEIKIRQDARIGRRQVDEREWARIGHWLLRRPNGLGSFANCIKTVLRATTFHEAVSGVLLVLGVVEPTGR
jgi:hypothetical protein